MTYCIALVTSGSGTHVGESLTFIFLVRLVQRDFFAGEAEDGQSIMGNGAQNSFMATCFKNGVTTSFY